MSNSLLSFINGSNFFSLPKFSLKELDLLFADFEEYKEQLLPTKKRFDAWLKSQGINPDAFLMEKLNRLKKD